MEKIVDFFDDFLLSVLDLTWCEIQMMIFTVTLSSLDISHKINLSI